MSNETLDIEKINTVLESLGPSSLDRKFTKVAEKLPGDHYTEKYQSGSSVATRVYRLDIGDWHLQVNTRTDSYGDCESICAIKFVKPVTKQVTDFE